MSVNIDYSPPGPVAAAFLQSKAFIQGLKGPVGSGKTSAAWIKVISLAALQTPNASRVRRTRWGVLRNTYPELKSTTIKTAQEWAPMMAMKWDAPIEGKMDFWLPDKTRVQADVYFLSFDRPDDIGKLKGLELTGGWMNEAVEMPKAAFDMLVQRVGRFPPKREGGPDWSGVILDTNPPDTDHWWFRVFETEKHKDWAVFHQPGGLIRDNKGGYLPNQLAENIDNLPAGYDYYLRQIAGKTKEWIKVFLEGQYGIVTDGKPIYPEYNDDLHCREIKPIEKGPLLIGLDYGLTPAAALCQISARGQLLIHDEVCADDMGVKQFARDALKPHLAMHWRDYPLVPVGDPSGNRRNDDEDVTAFKLLAEEGIVAVPAISNDFTMRREAVASYLTRLVDGQPALLVHPRCTRIRKGFMGGYCFKRLQVAGERYRDVADKNIYSHPHDGLQYAALFAKFLDTASFVKKIDYKEKVV